MKPLTVFIDLDGLLVKHSGEGASTQWYTLLELVPEARLLLDEMEKRGWTVILTTARKECVRKHTLQELDRLRLHYDGVLFGITSGHRWILNDAKPDSPDTAHAITLPRNGPINAQRIIAAMERP